MTLEEIKQTINDSLLEASDKLESLTSVDADALNEKVIACLALLK